MGVIITLVYYAIYALVVGNVILSYIPTARWHPLGRLVLQWSEPLLAPFRRIARPISLGNGVSFDLSPILCLVVVQIAYQLLMKVVK